MRVRRLLVHVTVTDRGEGLDTEKERFEERTRRHPGDAISAERIKRGKEKIDPDVNAGDEGGKARPIERENPLGDVAPLLPGVDLKKFELTGSSRNRPRRPMVHATNYSRHPVSAHSRRQRPCPVAVSKVQPPLLRTESRPLPLAFHFCAMTAVATGGRS